MECGTPWEGNTNMPREGEACSWRGRHIHFTKGNFFVVTPLRFLKVVFGRSQLFFKIYAIQHELPGHGWACFLNAVASLGSMLKSR